jgi:hypothetical protein
MTFFPQILDQPHSSKTWKRLFQVHLWCGIFLGLYLTIISVTGAVLVFEEQIEAHWRRELPQAFGLKFVETIKAEYGQM